METPMDVFKDSTEEQQPQSPITATEIVTDDDHYSNQLRGIVSSDGRQKYESVDKALEALAHSQSFIPTLQAKTQQQEQELAELRAQLAKTQGVQEVVDSLAQRQQHSQESDPQETKFGEEEVTRILEETLNRRTLEQQTAANTNKVNEALTATYGDKAASVVQTKAKELNTTPEELGKLAQSNPDLVLSLFNSKAKPLSLTTGSFQSSLTPAPTAPLGRPEKSLLSGATSRDQAEYMRRVKQEVYAKYQIEQ